MSRTYIEVTYIDPNVYFECGAPATERHHIVPASLGGTKTVPLCGICHAKIHDVDGKRRTRIAELTKAALDAKKAEVIKESTASSVEAIDSAESKEVVESIEVVESKEVADSIEVVESEVVVEPSKPEISREFQNALKSAQNYVDLMPFSEKGLYDQLTAEYGEQFPAEAAQYAIENVDVDYNAEALESAKNYQETMPMSDSGLYDQLTSEYGEKFTAEQAQYAINNLE